MVFDRGGLLDSERWARMHQAITGAIQKIVHPPNSDRFTIHRKVPRMDAHGTPSKRRVGNCVVPIKRQFLANLPAEMRLMGGGEDLESGLADLARCSGNLLMEEYPSRRKVGLDDEDFGAFLRHEAGDFDCYLSAVEGLRCVVKLESGEESRVHHSVSKGCFFMQTGLVDAAVLIVLSEQLASYLNGRVATWESILPYLPVWHGMGQAVEHGLLAVMAVEHDDLTDAPALRYLR